uniref:ZP domain-containing protein n=1 Tax=Xenopus tropicalis TaxID=8364 RepID=A0A803JX65_XENTR
MVLPNNSLYCCSEMTIIYISLDCGTGLTVHLYILSELSVYLPFSGSSGQAQRHFITAFMEGYSNPTLQLYLVTYGEAATVTVTVSAPSFHQSVSVGRNSTALVSLDSQYMITGTQISSKVVSVTSDADISLIAFHTAASTADAMAVLPVEDLDTEYFIFTSGSGQPNQFAVANGIYPTVLVTVTVSGSITYNGVQYGHGSAFSFSLGYQQVIQLQSPTDITGTRVVATSPVAVFSGNKCFTGINTACDVLLEQMHPVRNWGTFFPVFPLATHTNDIIDVMAANPDTIVIVVTSQQSTQYHLQPGSHERLTLDSAALVHSSEPVMISYLFQDRKNGQYDPFVTSVPPDPNTRKYYKFVTQSFYYNFLLVVSQAASPSEFYLDHQPLSSFPLNHMEINGFRAWEASLGKIDGQHEIYHSSSPFTIYVYGLEYIVSYGYSMGQETTYPGPSITSPTEELEILTSPTEEPKRSTSPTEEPERSTSPTEEPERSTSPTEEPEILTNPTEEPERSTSPTEEPERSTSPTEEPERSTSPTEEPERSTSPTEEPESPQELHCFSGGAEFHLPLRLVSEAKLNVSDVHLQDPHCLGLQEGNTIIINIPFNRCGSNVHIKDGKTVYTNTIYGTVPGTSIHRIEVPVKCEMDMNETLGLSFHPKVTDVVSQSHYNVSMRFYQTDEFTDLVTTFPHEVDLHGSLHLQLKVESDDTNLQILVEQCKASPSLEEREKGYSIIQHGCPLDSTLQNHPVPDQRMKQYSFHVFKFNPFQEVYLFCNVIICDNQTAPNRCTQGCITRRYRRDVSNAKLGSAQLSQGPIVLKSGEIFISYPYFFHQFPPIRSKDLSPIIP